MDKVTKSPAERRRARLRFRSARRGFKEVDLIFGAFADTHLDALDDAGMNQLEALLSAPDQEVYAWLKGEAPVPATHDTPVFRQLQALCRRQNPTWNA
jgi:antitoxin CptB